MGLGGDGGAGGGAATDGEHAAAGQCGVDPGRRMVGVVQWAVGFVGDGDGAERCRARDGLEHVWANVECGDGCDEHGAVVEGNDSYEIGGEYPVEQISVEARIARVH